MGGWVDGWETSQWTQRRRRVKRTQVFPRASLPIERVGGWVGGWVGGRVRRLPVDTEEEEGKENTALY